MARKDDAWLAERLLSRDEVALRRAISEYGASVLGMARRVVADASLAEEIAQDTFVALGDVLARSIRREAHFTRS